MDKYELSNYMANLTFIMDFHEKLGTTKNPFIVAEFEKLHGELVGKLQQENRNEARKSIEYKPAKAHADEVYQSLARSRV